MDDRPVRGGVHCAAWQSLGDSRKALCACAGAADAGAGACCLLPGRRGGARRAHCPLQWCARPQGGACIQEGGPCEAEEGDQGRSQGTLPARLRVDICPA